MPYATLEELRNAYHNGELTAPLMLDNDDTSVYHNGEPAFQMDPHDVMEQALTLLGIPYDYV